jgi:hypothetical protein
MSQRHFEEEVLRLLREDHNRIVEIEKLLKKKPVVYTAILRDTMAIGNINAGSTGTFAATLLENGAPLTTPPATPTVWTYSCSDPTVTITPSADTTSAVYSVPSNDTGTSFQAAASAVAPDGTTVTTPPLTVTLTPGTTTAVFSAVLNQTA